MTGAAFPRFVATAAGLFALVSIAVDVAGASRLAVARMLDDGKVLTAEGRAAARVHATTPTAPAVLSTCRRDVVRAGGLIAAADIDAVIRGGRIDLTTSALEELARASRRIVECDPGDGLAWAWSAMAADELGTEGTEEILRRLRISLWAAPSDLPVIRMRLTEAAYVGSRRGPIFDEIVRADVRTVLSSPEEPRTIAAVLGPVFYWIEPIAQEEFRAIDDPPRREALLQAFGPYWANIGGCDRKSFDDWLFRGQTGACADGDRIPDFDAHRGVSRPEATP